MEWLMALDHNIIFWIQNNLVSGTITPFMKSLSWSGNAGKIWIFFGVILFCIRKYRRTGIAVFIALFFSLIIGDDLLKHTVMRSKPCIDYPWVPLHLHMPAANNYSFPSAHAFSSFAAAFAMVRGIRNRWILLMIVLAVGIAFSRVYLFMHYPSDVLAGAFLGISAGAAAWYLSGKLFLKRKK
ncbi:phosphatase PAP2 family protein [Pectinatus haikarae]|uniref:Undecaprenyl-diphosphatase n=1 Tax=Pectinatus haikarae TaxID=349096 RepID=A0ABT9Y9D4_9FIRM|nr:phosphatase PAP2 family protein [Pectinatus haikarae]MDQ0204354.1 undecaprenyl-diphosphatase [Pectinatus haikarae]